MRNTFVTASICLLRLLSVTHTISITCLMPKVLMSVRKGSFLENACMWLEKQNLTRKSLATFWWIFCNGMKFKTRVKLNISVSETGLFGWPKVNNLILTNSTNCSFEIIWLLILHLFIYYSCVFIIYYYVCHLYYSFTVLSLKYRSKIDTFDTVDLYKF